MNITPPSPPQPPSSSSDNNGTGGESGGEGEGEGESESESESDNESDNDPSNNKDDNPPEPGSKKGASSAEYLFSQEVLRRRLSEMSKQKPIKPGQTPKDVALDLSIVTDDTSEVRKEEMSKDEADDFINQFEGLSHVWVILFTNETDGTEGVYSLSIGGDNIILAFQERQEAHRYSVVLESQQFPQPQIGEMDPKELRQFCQDSGYKLGFIPTGMFITPPEESAVDDLDKWRGSPTESEGSTGMSEEDIDAMRKHFDSLFGQ